MEMTMMEIMQYLFIVLISVQIVEEIPTKVVISERNLLKEEKLEIDQWKLGFNPSEMIVIEISALEKNISNIQKAFLSKPEVIVSLAGNEISRWIHSYSIQSGIKYLSFKEGFDQLIPLIIEKWSLTNVIIITDQSKKLLRNLSRNYQSFKLLNTAKKGNTTAMLKDYLKKEKQNNVFIFCEYRCLHYHFKEILKMEVLVQSISGIFLFHRFANLLNKLFEGEQIRSIVYSTIVILASYKVMDLKEPLSIEIHQLNPVTMSEITVETDTIGVYSKSTLQLIEEPLQINNMKGIVLRVAIFEDSPYTGMEILPNKTVEATEYSGEILANLKRSLQFETKFVVGENYAYGSLLPNKSWDGIAGMLVRKEADIGIIPLASTPSRAEVLDFSTYVYSYSYSIVIRNPLFGKNQGFDSSFRIYTASFHLTVWKCSLIMIAVVIIVLALSETTANPRYSLQRQNGIFKFSKIIFTLAVQQVVAVPNIKTSSKIVIASFLLFCVIINVSYKSMLTSLLAVQVTKVPFKNVIDILDAGYQIGILKSINVVEILKNSKEHELNYRIWQRMRSRPDNLVETMEEGLDKVLKEKFGFFMISQTFESQFGKNCTYFSLPTTYFPGQAYLPFPKGSPYVRVFKKYVNILRETGNLHKISRKYLKTPPASCDVSAKATTSIYSCCVPFVILALGVATAIVSCLFELQIYRMTKLVKMLKIKRLKSSGKIQIHDG